MKTRKTKFEYYREIDALIKETASEIYSGLDLDEKQEHPSELAERYEEEITEAIWQHIDNAVIYYTDAAHIVLEFGCYNGWNELELLGGEAPTNISQLAFAILYESAFDEGILGGYSWAFEEVKEEVQKLKNELKEAKQ